MTAYYNENDKYAAEWLLHLIWEDLIAPGIVDTRSIEDVTPNDLKGFDQCHFFAGIGVWSHSLRLAGWPDDRAVWTGSCPCQPFSSAGEGKGFADERHLWPSWLHLIEQCHPRTIFGEQVSNGGGLAWLELVHADLEKADYSVGAFDLCAAGVGAPHIRQRLYFVADNNNGRAQFGATRLHAEGSPRHDVAGRGADGDVVDTDGLGCGARRSSEANGARPLKSSRCGDDGDVADADSSRVPNDGPGDAHSPPGQVQGGAQQRQRVRTHAWERCDFIPCTDGKWRPVEPGTFPLAHGAPSRVGRLRAYGNAIVAPLAKEFIEAYMSI